MLLLLLSPLVQSVPDSKWKAFCQVSFLCRRPQCLHAKRPYRDSTGVIVWLLPISAQLGALSALPKGHCGDYGLGSSVLQGQAGRLGLVRLGMGRLRVLEGGQVDERRESHPLVSGAQ